MDTTTIFEDIIAMARAYDYAQAYTRMIDIAERIGERTEIDTDLVADAREAADALDLCLDRPWISEFLDTGFEHDGYVGMRAVAERGGMQNLRVVILGICSDVAAGRTGGEAATAMSEAGDIATACHIASETEYDEDDYPDDYPDTWAAYEDHIYHLECSAVRIMSEIETLVSRSWPIERERRLIEIEIDQWRH